MASKYRPKGSYKDYLKLTAKDFSSLTTAETNAIVNKLNDAANKRLKRLEEHGLKNLSPSYRARKGTRFTLPKGASIEEAKASYLKAKNFLDNLTSTVSGAVNYSKRFKDTYAQVLGKPLDDPSNYDKRYKKKKFLKKSVEKKLSDFWRKYEAWKEIQEKNNPDSTIGDTNGKDVEYFAEEVYSKGKVSIPDMEKKAEEDYLKHEQEEQEEDNNDYEEGLEPLQPSKPKRDGKGATKQGKYKGKRGKTKVTATTWKPKVSFESVSIFDDDDF